VSTRAWSATGDGLLLTVRLTPRGGRDALDGTATLADGREVLKARVRAVPEDGAANRALAALLATELAVPRSALVLQSGATSRIKTFHITGDCAELAARLAQTFGG
jgi:uncharacterized protein YggU (UPF0235/DUF167 family)